MSFWFSGNRDSNILVVDISSGTTSVALIATSHGKVPRVLTAIESEYNFSSNGNSLSPDVAMLASLKSVLEFIVGKLSTLKGVKVDRAVITFSSPWVDSYLKTVQISKEQEFVFDEKYMFEVISEEKSVFQNTLKESFAEESEIFEAAVMDLYVNGYPASVPKKEKVSEVEISFILSASTKDLLARVEDQIIRTLAIKKGIVMHSFMYIFYKVLSHSFSNLHSALLINMTTHITDVLFLRHNNLALNANLPFGPESIVNAVSTKLNISDEIASSYLTLFAEGALDKSTTESIDKILTENESVWRDIWSDVKGKIVQSAEVPYSIFLVTTPKFGKLMKTFLESVFPDKNIILIGDTNTFTRELVENGARESKDERILLLSSFANLIS